MIEGPRENLALIHSFPTNSNLLAGFYDYLGNYFNVHPIDLPGFTRAVKPLDDISIPSYAQFVRDQLQNLDLDQYLLGGISFGFAVANDVIPDQRCRGLIAMEPYLNADSLHLNAKKIQTYLSLLRLASTGGLGERMWGSPILNRFLGTMMGYPVDKVESMTNQIHGRAFLKTGQVILENTDPPKFHDLPYALVVNPTDSTINYDQLVSTFRQGVSNLHIVHTKVDHYPKDMTPAYFRERINLDDIRGMIEWFKAHQAA